MWSRQAKRPRAFPRHGQVRRDIATLERWCGWWISDWAAIDTAIGHIEDPLFGLNPSERYAALEEHLGRQVTAAS